MMLFITFVKIILKSKCRNSRIWTDWWLSLFHQWRHRWDSMGLSMWVLLIFNRIWFHTLDFISLWHHILQSSQSKNNMILNLLCQRSQIKFLKRNPFLQIVIQRKALTWLAVWCIEETWYQSKWLKQSCKSKANQQSNLLIGVPPVSNAESTTNHLWSSQEEI